MHIYLIRCLFLFIGRILQLERERQSPLSELDSTRCAHQGGLVLIVKSVFVFLTAVFPRLDRKGKQTLKLCAYCLMCQIHLCNVTIGKQINLGNYEINYVHNGLCVVKLQLENK